MRFKLVGQLALAASMVAAVPSLASAAIISMDIRAEFGLNDDDPSDYRVFEVIGASATTSPQLNSSHQIANPSGYGGRADVALDATQQQVSIIGADPFTDLPVDGVNSADFYFARVTITNIVFDVAGEEITALSLLEDGLLYQSPDLPYALNYSFTGNSLTFEWIGDNGGTIYVLDGGLGLFAYETSVDQNPGQVPAPLPLSLIGLGLAGLAWSRRKA